MSWNEFRQNDFLERDISHSMIVIQTAIVQLLGRILKNGKDLQLPKDIVRTTLPHLRGDLHEFELTFVDLSFTGK